MRHNGNTRATMFCYQAPGFVEHGPNGERLCCELLMLMQGAIDASRLFGTAFGHTLLKRAGARRALWDRDVWEYHKGPLAASAESLEKILATYNDQPPTPGAPPGSCRELLELAILMTEK